MSYTVSQLAEALGFPFVGDGTLDIRALAEPADAGADDLALASNPKYADKLAQGAARAALLWADADWQALGLEAAILPERPRYAMSHLTRMYDLGQGFEAGIHPTAVIDPTADVASDASVGAFSIVAAGAKIGAGSVIGPQCYVGVETVLGPRAFLREQVSIGARVKIGADFMAHPGVRIGGDGFSFVTVEKSNVEAARESLGTKGDIPPQAWHRIHSLGGVEIGDGVEIGANSTVDNGTIRATRVGDRTKVDSLVQIGHNATIGQDCLLCAQSGVAGSAVLGNSVVLGGKAGVSDNITVGDRVVAGAASALLSNVPAGRVMMGSPATQMESHIASYQALRRLPRRLADLERLKKAVFKSGDSD